MILVYNKNIYEKLTNKYKNRHNKKRVYKIFKKNETKNKKKVIYC